jgi:tRNA (guanine37-N1)-methyltransferase
VWKITIEKTIAIKVLKDQGETVRNKMIDAGLLNRDLRIDRDEEFLYLPLTKRPENGERDRYEVIEHEFETIKSHIQRYQDITEVPEDLRNYLPTSFDIVGQVALVKLPDEVLTYKKEIGKAFLNTHNNLKTVVLDKGVKGEFRVRDIEVIAGIPCTLTVHTEYGIKLLVDLWEAYFSPRLASERYRVAQLVRTGEVVVDMFAGVGPFSIMISKHSNPSKIFAIDKNPKAIDCLINNIEINKAKGINAFCGDSRIIIKELIQEIPGFKVDRIIMNLPHSAFDFIEDALSIIRNGGILHYHEIMETEYVETRITEIVKRIGDHGYNCEIENMVIVGTYSPREDHICLDIRIGS